MHLSYATVAVRSAELSAMDAAALVLAAADACVRGRTDRARAVPPADVIVLSRAGRVSVPRGGAAASDAERVMRLSALLRLLLGLDRLAAGVSRADVPGPLMLLLARANGEIDLPMPAYVEFVDVLRRFGPADRRRLAGIYLRCAPPAAGFGSGRLAEPVAASLIVVTAAAAFLTVTGPRRPEAPSPPPPRVAASHPAVGVADAGTGSEGLAAKEDAVTVRSEPTDRTPRLPAGSAAAAAPLLSSSQVGTDVFSPSFSDERELLFHAGRDRAVLMRASFDREGRADVETILDDGAANYHAVPSPDGRWFAFDSDREGTRGVYVGRADADAADIRRISGDGYAAVPRWSPDGGKLAFIKADPSRPRVWNVWVAHLASGALQQVSRHRVGQAWGASWFPDGQRLAYSVEDRLVIGELRTGARHVVNSPLSGRLLRTPAVSPDGRHIVFQVQHDGVWLLETATGRMRRVLGDPAAEEFAWSPDGRHIAFHTRRGGAWSLWRISFDNS